MEATVAVEPLVIFLMIGAVAGWLAGVVVKGYGFGLVGNVLVGVIGSCRWSMAAVC
jgi:uncharacterized membrane protein YeaQ/YmgE (transglycosylase-associated protein family)